MSTRGRILNHAPAKDVLKEFVQGTMNMNKISCNILLFFEIFVYFNGKSNR